MGTLVGEIVGHRQWVGVRGLGGKGQDRGFGRKLSAKGCHDGSNDRIKN